MLINSIESRTRIIEDLQKLYRFGEWAARRGVEQDCRCIYCDRDFLESFNDYDSWQFDHVHPTSLDGEHSYENIVVCCKTCNYLKLNYAPTGNTYEERIADARRYIHERRAERDAELTKIRLLVRET